MGNPVPLTLSLAHAFTPNESGGYGGADHIVISHAFTLGQLDRQAGDALCKPKRKFWSLQSVVADGHRRICNACLRRAQKLAIEFGIDYEHLLGKNEGTP